MEPQMVFKRYEIKYRMTCRQQAAILRAMEAHMQAILDEVEKQVEEFDENNADLPRWIR